MPSIDTHQHLWSEPLWEALIARSRAPFITRDGARWTLHLPAEPACAMQGPDHVGTRDRLLDDDGVDIAVIAPSPALGLEWLPRDEAEPLFEAQRQGVNLAGDRYRRWATINLREPDRRDVRRELQSGAVGVCISASALQGAREIDRLGAVLEELERSEAPLFVHPGPSPADVAEGAGRWTAQPWWWPGLTDYVASMQRAWLAWVWRGRPEHPKLRVSFAMLAGLAPLHASRLAVRGAPSLAARAVADPLTWFETSSYDADAQGAVARVVGARQLVHGTDRPVVRGALPAPIVVEQSTAHVEALLGKAA